MARKGIYDWEHEPSGMRKSGYASTVASGWHQSAESTFAEPSRLEIERRRSRRNRQRRRTQTLLLMGLAMLALAILAAWIAFTRFWR